MSNQVLSCQALITAYVGYSGSFQTRCCQSWVSFVGLKVSASAIAVSVLYWSASCLYWLLCIGMENTSTISLSTYNQFEEYALFISSAKSHIYVHSATVFPTIHTAEIITDG